MHYRAVGVYGSEVVDRKALHHFVQVAQEICVVTLFDDGRHLYERAAAWWTVSVARELDMSRLLMGALAHVAAAALKPRYKRAGYYYLEVAG